MQIIPLQAIPNQTLFVTLNNQNCQINAYQQQTGLYFDLYVNAGTTLVIAGVLAQNLRLMVISAYLGFIGDFMFLDNQGQADPDYTGLGTRFSLVYVAPGDIAPTSIAAWAGMT